MGKKTENIWVLCKARKYFRRGIHLERRRLLLSLFYINAKREYDETTT